MKGLHPYPQRESELREQWRVIGDVEDELYFGGFLEPNMGFADAGLVRAVAFPDGSYIEFPDAGTPVWWHRLRRRDRWLAAGLYVKIWYTSTVGSTANFQLDMGVRETQPGDVMGAGFPLRLATSLVFPGPAVAGTEMAFEKSFAASVITGQGDLVQLSFNRVPADANVNPLRLLGVYYRVLPS